MRIKPRRNAEQEIKTKSFEDADVPDPRHQLVVQIDQKFKGITWARGNVSLLHYIGISIGMILIVDLVSTVLSEGSDVSFVVALAVGLVVMVIAFQLELWWKFRKCMSCEQVVPIRWRYVDWFPQTRICSRCSKALRNGTVVSDAESSLEANWQDWKRRKSADTPNDDAHQ